MEPLVKDLLDPGAFPPPERGRTTLEETHISWVFLGPGSVYKVKKPVNLGFLDFSTREQRLAACRMEMVVNAALGGTVYQGVVPVLRGADGVHRLHGDGEVVDHAVKMVRLARAHRADARLKAGTLGHAELAALAQRVSEFHARARTGPGVDELGGQETLANNVEENIRQATPLVDRAEDRRSLENAAEWQRAFLRQRTPILAERVAQGRIREGHGDLRLEHVYFEGGGPVVLDAIEFNERFRCADTAADLAFLAMELAHAGRVDLGEFVVAQYARSASDHDLYAVLDFYESYRAFVRAKIALMGAVHAPASRRGAAHDEAARYLRQSASAGRRMLVPPVVVAVGGVIATGKSTVADELALHTGAVVVDTDRTRKHLAGARATQPMTDPAWAGVYGRDFTRTVYDEVFRRASRVLESGRGVIVDATFQRQEFRDAARQLANRHGVPFLHVECRAPPEVCRARLVERERTEHVSDGRAEIFDAFVARYEQPVEDGGERMLVVDTTRPLQEVVERVQQRVPTWRGGHVGGERK